MKLSSLKPCRQELLLIAKEEPASGATASVCKDTAILPLPPHRKGRRLSNFDDFMNVFV